MAAKDIMEARGRLKDQRFSRIEDFFENVDLRKVNKKTLESLIKAGAFDGFGYNRREIYENCAKLLNYAQKVKADKEMGQESLFAMESSLSEESRVQMEPVKPWTHREQLGFERDMLGFYLSDHPMEPFKGLEKQLGLQLVDDLEKSYNTSSPVRALGIVSHLKETMTKKSERIMAFGQLEDSSGSIEVIFFPNIYKEYASALSNEGDIVLIKGSLRKEKEAVCRLIVEQVQGIDEFLKEVKRFKCCIPRSAGSKDLKHLKDLFQKKSDGSAGLVIGSFLEGRKAFVEVQAGNIPDKIRVDQDLLQEMYKIFKSKKDFHISLK